MKNIYRNGPRLLAVAILVVTGSLYSSYASAQSSELFGQTHAYDVLLRGNGKAVVNARISVTNTDDDAKNELYYDVANGSLGTVTAFQQINCSDIEPIPVSESTSDSTSGTSTPGSLPGSGVGDVYSAADQVILSDCEKNYSSYRGSTYYGTIYKKVDIERRSGGSFKLSLPYEVGSDKTATVIMIYDLSGIVVKNAGVYSYDFKTLQTTDTISRANVAVSVDEEFVLADASGDVDYRDSGFATSLESNLSVGASADSGLNNYVGRIGTYGGIRKSASYLAPQETFSVTGTYASNNFILNWQRNATWLFAIIAVIGLLVVWYRYRRSRLSRQDNNGQDQNGSGSTTKTPDIKSSLQIDEETGVDQSNIPSASPITQTAPLVSPDVRLRAIPLYSFWAKLYRVFRNRRMRPMFFGWLVSFMATLSIGIVVFSIALAAQSDYYTYGSGVSLLNDVLAPVLFVVLAAIGVLSTVLFMFILPIIYAKSLRGALPIYFHIILGYAFLAAIIWLVLANGGSADQPTYYDNGMYLH